MNKQQKTFIIAEIGQAHDGSLETAHSYIDAVYQTGVDAIKFQTHIAEAESSVHEPFRVKFACKDKTRYDYWKRMEFTKDQWLGIKKHCDEVNIEFMSSPFSNAAVDLLEEVGVKRYKIGSGEVNNFLILEKIAKTNKEIILSSGMSSFDELDDTINFLKFFGNKVSILQCTTKYPTGPEDAGLNVISELKARYGLTVGFSDHSGTIFASLAAAYAGAEILEVHAVFDKNMPGPDATSSLTMEELRQLVEGVSFIDKALASPVNKSVNSEYKEVKNIFEKSLSVSKDLEEGHVIIFDDLEGKKPFGYGIPARDFKNVIGAKLKSSKKKYDFLTEEDIVE